MRFLVKHRTLTQFNQTLARPSADSRSTSNHQPQFVKPICCQFNLSGCNWPQRGFQHVCLVTNCSQPHPQHKHPSTMSNQCTWLGPSPCLHQSSLNIDTWTADLTNDIDCDYLLQGLTRSFCIISCDSELLWTRWGITNQQLNMMFTTTLKRQYAKKYGMETT